MSTGEEEDGNQADGRPQVAVLEDRQQVRPRNAQECDCCENGCRHCNNSNPVNRAAYRRVRAIRYLSADPGVDLLGGLVSIKVSRLSYA